MNDDTSNVNTAACDDSNATTNGIGEITSNESTWARSRISARLGGTGLKLTEESSSREDRDNERFARRRECRRVRAHDGFDERLRGIDTCFSRMSTDPFDSARNSKQTVDVTTVITEEDTAERRESAPVLKVS